MANYNRPKPSTSKYEQRSKIVTPEDIEKHIAFLNKSFANACYKAKDVIGSQATRIVDLKGKAKTTELYDLQVDYAYIINKAQINPSYIAPKFIQEAKDLITGIRALVDA